jgi:hypothetical protein
MKFVLAFLFMQILMSYAMSYGKVFPTHIQEQSPYVRDCLVVKDVSQLAEFADLVLNVDDTRRYLELRDGIVKAKKKHFTFRCMCGPSYVSVFGSK